MEPRLDVITLAVANLGRALAFYRGLGLESKGVMGTEWTDEVAGANGAIAMFKPEGAFSSTFTRGPISPRTQRFP